MIKDEDKKWIDEASYRDLLERWRYSAVGDSIFTGETGAYYREIMRQKRETIGHDAAVQISKDIDE